MVPQTHKGWETLFERERERERISDKKKKYDKGNNEQL